MAVENFTEPLMPHPSGVIIKWYNSRSEIPPGWVECDGNNGTPNLRNKVPKSVPDTATDPGGTGGSDSKTLSVSQLPSHSHTATSIGTVGDHYHGLTDYYAYVDSDTSTGKSHKDGTNYSQTTGTSGSHSHSGTLQKAGGSSSIDNRPAYTEMTFIQKL